MFLNSDKVYVSGAKFKKKKERREKYYSGLIECGINDKDTQDFIESKLERDLNGIFQEIEFFSL